MSYAKCKRIELLKFNIFRAHSQDYSTSLAIILNYGLERKICTIKDIQFSGFNMC